MAKYDLESLLSDIESTLSANLNTKLASLDSEKSDSITLKTFDSSAYFFQELNSKVANYNPFILYSIEAIENDPIYGASIKKCTVSIVIVLADSSLEDSAPKMVKRMLRYQRALVEVIEENFTLMENQVNLEVQSLVPVDFPKLNSSERYRAIGVNLTAVFA